MVQPNINDIPAQDLITAGEILIKVSMLPAALEVGKQASKNSKDATEKKASEEFVSKVKKLIKDKQLV